jgi:hypothetical protein
MAGVGEDPQKRLNRPAEQPKKPWDSACDLQSLKVFNISTYLNAL